jgi:hypothetical protein
VAEGGWAGCTVFRHTAWLGRAADPHCRLTDREVWLAIGSPCPTTRSSPMPARRSVEKSSRLSVQRSVFRRGTQGRGGLLPPWRPLLTRVWAVLGAPGTARDWFPQYRTALGRFGAQRLLGALGTSLARHPQGVARVSLQHLGHVLRCASPAAVAQASWLAFCLAYLGRQRDPSTPTAARV